MCFFQCRQDHCGPLLGLLLTAEVKTDAIVRRCNQNQFMTLWGLQLVVYEPQIKFCYGLGKTKTKKRKQQCERMMLRKNKEVTEIISSDLVN